MIEVLPSREVAVELFGWSVRWYGVLYVLAFAAVYWLGPRLQHWRGLQLTREQWLELTAWGAAGTIIGGRLGYVLFYEPLLYAAEPMRVLALWDGGMSSHGGFIGVGVAVWLGPAKLLRSRGVNLLALLDVLVVPIALGLMLGRVGNVINQELFPSTAVQVLAVLKNLVVAGVVYAHLRLARASRPGRTAALFLITYSVFRFGIEFIRVQEWQTSLGLTRGQLLTLPLFAIGIWLWRRSGNVKDQSPNFQ